MAYAFFMSLFKCTINGRVKSKKNAKQIFRGRNGKPFITSSKDFKTWHLMASVFVTRAKVQETIHDKCELSIKVYFANNNHSDLDNILNSISDVLQDCGIIKNDKLFYKMTAEKFVDKETKERVEIEIKPLI